MSFYLSREVPVVTPDRFVCPDCDRTCEPHEARDVLHLPDGPHRLCRECSAWRLSRSVSMGRVRFEP